VAAKLQQQPKLVIKLVQAQQVWVEDWDTVTLCGRKLHQQQNHSM